MSVCSDAGWHSNSIRNQLTESEPVWLICLKLGTETAIAEDPPDLLHSLRLARLSFAISFCSATSIPEMLFHHVEAIPLPDP